MTYPANGQPQQPVPSQYTPAAAPLFPAATAEDVPWARQSTRHDPQTKRARQLVRSLPSWDPLPPGEILVSRRRRD